MNAATLAPAGRRAAVDLAAIREQWGDLLAAIDTPPRGEWPPRDSRALGVTADEQELATAIIGRTPLTLREHPAPLNLDALDAALAVERALFDSCDAIAAAVQRPMRTISVPTFGNPDATIPDGDDARDPARWHYPSPTDPGSRAYGLHWAAVWLEGRALDEPSGDLFRPLPPGVADDLATVAHRARTRIERALAREQRTTQLADPCPWCRGQLTARSERGETAVTCSTGEPCGAPVLLDHGRRVWRGADLVGLWVALDARRRKAAPE